MLNFLLKSFMMSLRRAFTVRMGSESLPELKKTIQSLFSHAIQMRKHPSTANNIEINLRRQSCISRTKLTFASSEQHDLPLVRLVVGRVVVVLRRR